MLNAITVDVEDWFQVSVFRNIIDYGDWEKQECRLIPNICKILEIFDEYQVKATFFVLGWVAERYPEVVLTIKKYGHEIGSHGYGHKIIYEQSREDFIEDFEKSLVILESILDEKIIYYRAPGYSITRSCVWVFEEIAKRGILCDSSIYPIKHDMGGNPNMPREPFFIEFKNGIRLNEFPLSTRQLWNANVPFSGGGYLRLLPYWFVRNAIKTNNAAGIPVVIYFHPWEMDYNLPKYKLAWLSKFRHYTNVEFTEEKVRKLLSEFSFTSLGELSKSFNIERRWPTITDNNNHFH
jgi:polysaccharide deacetylase family protein (PEP-CTERM system associated)